MYSKAKARIRVTEADGSVTHTDYFDIRRGIVQGDCFSALAFIIATESVMRKHDPGGGVSVLGRLVSRLEFADDIALIDQTPEAATKRLTLLAKAFRDDADMHVAIHKTHAMIIRKRVETSEITELDYEHDSLTHQCKSCARRFDSWDGLNNHRAQHCGEVDRDARTDATEWPVDAVTDANGAPNNRYYKIKWKGHPDETWIPSRYAKCEDLIREYFSRTGQNTADDLQGSPAAIAENRCPWCNNPYKRPQDLKGHLTKKRDARGGCKSKPGSRQGSRTQTAVTRRKQCDIQAEAGQVFLEETLLSNVFDFKYLGFTFSADGDFRHAISVRMAQAKARFGQLWKIWGSELPRSAQINLYAAAVIAMLIHGHQAWPLTDKVLKSLKHFNANCIAKITGDPHDTCYRNQADFFDIEGILRARRLKWVGKTLRTTIPSLAREVLISRAEENIATKHCQKGSIMMDVPPHTTMHQLMELAEDKRGWMEFVRAIHNPKSRKCSYTRRTTEASEILEMEAEVWHKGAKTLQFKG